MPEKSSHDKFSNFVDDETKKAIDALANYDYPDYHVAGYNPSTNPHTARKYYNKPKTSNPDPESNDGIRTITDFNELLTLFNLEPEENNVKDYKNIGDLIIHTTSLLEDNLPVKVVGLDEFILTKKIKILQDRIDKLYQLPKQHIDKPQNDDETTQNFLVDQKNRYLMLLKEIKAKSGFNLISYKILTPDDFLSEKELKIEIKNLTDLHSDVKREINSLKKIEDQFKIIQDKLKSMQDKLKIKQHKLKIITDWIKDNLEGIKNVKDNTIQNIIIFSTERQKFKEYFNLRKEYETFFKNEYKPVEEEYETFKNEHEEEIKQLNSYRTTPLTPEKSIIINVKDVLNASNREHISLSFPSEYQTVFDEGKLYAILDRNTYLNNNKVLVNNTHSLKGLFLKLLNQESEISDELNSYNHLH